MLINRPEFHIADLAVVTAGGTPFSIYQTYTADQIRYVIEDSGAKVIITEQAYLPVVQEAREELPGDRARDPDRPARGGRAGGHDRARPTSRARTRTSTPRPRSPR